MCTYCVKHMLTGDGATGVLVSSYPPITPSAWPSITTGVNPGKHGIFDFARTDLNTGEQKLTRTCDLEHPRIYEMLATLGIETLVFNPIPPYPLVPMEKLKVASVAFSPRPVCPVLKLTKKTYESPTVDPVASRAYSPTPVGHGALVKNINDLEATRKIVMQQKGIANVRYREEVYWGAYVSRAPNLIVMVDREAGYRLGSNRIERRIVDEKAVWDHDPYGVVALAGEGVRSGDIGLVNAWDVAPTIMAYMGAALADDSDGKALNAIPGTSASEGASYDYASRCTYQAKLRSLSPEV
jgi:predicted AlkP superfamily phosphohydrolase/phosphomutase